MSALANAYSRLARADEHFKELKALHFEACDAQAKATVIQFNPASTIGPGQAAELFRVDNTRHQPVPERCALLAGDVANSLRSALNYLVVKLAILDSGARGKRNQFPIESSPEAFEGNNRGARGFLYGVSQAHSAAIEKLQPYNGCNWTQALSDISNFDKHTDLILVAHDQRVSIVADTEPAADGMTTRVSMQVKIEPVLRISLGNGMPLIETLEVVKSQVSDLLDAFNLEFQ